LRTADDEIIPPTRIENVQVHDGINIAVAVYLPKDAGRYPTGRERCAVVAGHSRS
jgi:hypothetical protein